MAEPAATPAADTEAAPAAPASDPNAAPANESTSLLDAAPADPPKGEDPPADPPKGEDPPADPPKGEDPPKDPPKDSDGKWYYANGVEGVGDPPEWFKASKYNTITEQAKAYNELEKRFGAFTGAPEGDYELSIPEEAKQVIDIDTTHPIFDKFTKYAREQNMSQEAFNGVLGLFAEYEAEAAMATVTDIGEIKKELGANADARINSVKNWASANLDEEAQTALREATSGPDAAKVFKAVEAVVGKTRQASMPKPGEDVQPAPASKLEEINSKMAEKNEKGERRYVVEPKFREHVEKLRRDWFASQSKPTSLV